MSQHLKIETLSLLWILCILSSAKGSFECANITNITRTSATSVLIEWQYTLPALMGSGFNLKVFKNSSLVQELPRVMDFFTQVDTRNRNHTYLVNNLNIDSQHLCFMVQFENVDLLTTTNPTTLSPHSSGDYNGSESDISSCTQECLPVSSQVPDAPQGFLAANSTTTSSSEVVFSWNSTTASVILACSRNNSIVPIIIREFCGRCGPVHIGGFEHSSRYTCTLSEKTGVIVGLSSTYSFTTDVERLAPPNFTVTSVTSTSITVNIQALNSQYHYEICTMLNPGGQPVYICFNFSSVLTIPNLYPYSTYDIQVRVRKSSSNNNYWSYPSNKTATTIEEAPVKIMLVSVHLLPGTSKIFVSWTPPQINNGSITEYRYCWRSRLYTESCVNTTGNSTIIIIEQTAQGAVYSVSVAAYTEGGVGPFSDDVYVHIPGAVVPPMTSTYNNGDSTASYIQLKLKGLYNCKLWMANSQTLGNDIINDLSAQISNSCKCNTLLNSAISNVNLQCINDSRKQESDEFLFHASFNCDNCQQRTYIEQWFNNPSSHITVSNQSLLILLDRSCPLYTTSLASTECSGPGTTKGSNGGAVAGALIGGILIGVILAVGVGLGIVFFLLWLKRHRGRGSTNKMKKIEAGSDTPPLSTRYTSADKNTHQQSNDDYEPITSYARDSIELENVYEPTGGGEVVQISQEQKSKKGQKKPKATKISSSKEHSSKKVFEDEAGYVVPDVLWEGKKRPTAPNQTAKAQTSTGKANIASTRATTTTMGKVEYDVPEGVDVSAGSAHHAQKEQRSKFKGQPEMPSSTVKPQSEKSRKQFTADRTQGAGKFAEGLAQPSTGKGHQKQLHKLQQPATTVSTQQEQTHTSQTQPVKQGKDVVKPVQSGKPAKKNKPRQHPQNPSELARQYQSGGTSSAAKTATGAAQSHDAMKSKLQNLLTPSTAAVAAHAPLSRQTSSSTVEKTKTQDSLVKAMATMLEGGGGQTSSGATGSETEDTKTKKKAILPKPAGSSTTLQTQQQPQPSLSAESTTTVPTKKPKPLGKGTANIALKTNKAYDNWQKEKDAVSSSAPSHNPRGRVRGNDNLYHF